MQCAKKINAIIITLCMMVLLVNCDDSGSNSKNDNKSFPVKYNKTYGSVTVKVNGKIINDLSGVAAGTKIEIEANPKQDAVFYQWELKGDYSDNPETTKIISDQNPIQVKYSANTADSYITCVFAYKKELIDKPLTSETSFPGVTISSDATTYIGKSLYKAFDDNTGTDWGVSAVANVDETIEIEFDESTFPGGVCINQVYVDINDDTSYRPANIALASKQSETGFWATKFNINTQTISVSGTTFINNENPSEKCRPLWKITFTPGSGARLYITELRLFQYVPKYPE